MGGNDMLDLMGCPDAMAASCIEKELCKADITCFTAYPGVHAKVQGPRLGVLYFQNGIIVGFARRATHWRVRCCGLALSQNQKELFYEIIRSVGMPDILPNRLCSETEEDSLAMWAVKKIAGLKTLACDLRRAFGSTFESNSTIEECVINGFGWSLFPPPGRAEEQIRATSVYTAYSGNFMFQWMCGNSRIPLVQDAEGSHTVILPQDVRQHADQLRAILDLREAGMYTPRTEGVTESVRLFVQTVEKC